MKASEVMRVLRLSRLFLTKYVYKGRFASNAFIKIEVLDNDENSKN